MTHDQMQFYVIPRTQKGGEVLPLNREYSGGVSYEKKNDEYFLQLIELIIVSATIQ